MKSIEGISIEEKKTLKRLLSRLSEENGAEFNCDQCGESIVSGEKYFVSENSIAKMALEDGKIVETKISVWQKQLLCIGCYAKENSEIEVDEYERDDTC